jgi:hypothetical protein
MTLEHLSHGDKAFPAQSDNCLRLQCMWPLAQEFFASEVSSVQSFASQHTFTIRYKAGEDIKLATHVDASTVTLNVCLGKAFAGGQLYFHGLKALDVSHDDHDAKGESSASPGNAAYDEQRCTLRYDHQISYGLVHLGRHVHGATHIETGERCNLVFWAKA